MRGHAAPRGQAVSLRRYGDQLARPRFWGSSCTLLYACLALTPKDFVVSDPEVTIARITIFMHAYNLTFRNHLFCGFFFFKMFFLLFTRRSVAYRTCFRFSRVRCASGTMFPSVIPCTVFLGGRETRAISSSA